MVLDVFYKEPLFEPHDWKMVSAVLGTLMSYKKGVKELSITRFFKNKDGFAWKIMLQECKSGRLPKAIDFHNMGMCLA